MALKPDRNPVEYAIDYFLDEVQERGKIVSISTGGSGVANDDALQQATAAANPSGNVPIGVLLQDTVNIDLAKFHINHHKDEQPKGSKVAILKKGQVPTDMIDPAVTPSAGDSAYLSGSGYITNVAGGGNPKVGRFDTAKDEDGFAKVSVNLPL